MGIFPEALTNGHSLQNGHSAQNGHSLQNGHGAPAETVDHDAPLSSDARIFSRDGIVGSWQALVDDGPGQHVVDDPDNMALWASEVRASVIDSELHSALGFGVVPAMDPVERKTAALWHLQVGGFDGKSPPGAVYQPLMIMTRPGEGTFVEQLNFVAAYADLQQDRRSEILAQLPGPMAFLSAIAFLHPERSRWTIELLSAALRLAVFAEMRFKHVLACRRPIEFSPQVQPIIMTPAHGTLPSGHATEAFIAALVLRSLLRVSGSRTYGSSLVDEQCMRLAARIAINRTVAGVHFPVDSAAGAVLGLALGQYFVQRCSGSRHYTPFEFDGDRYKAGNDFNWRHYYSVDHHGLTEDCSAVTRMTDESLGEDGPAALQWLWNKALAEWR